MGRGIGRDMGIGPGMGVGPGMGGGMGRGMGMGPGIGIGPGMVMDPGILEQELEALKAQSQMIGQQLSEIMRRLDDLEEKSR